MILSPVEGGLHKKLLFQAGGPCLGSTSAFYPLGSCSRWWCLPSLSNSRSCVRTTGRLGPTLLAVRGCDIDVYKDRKILGDTN
jgi:hypothetical protein